jgi:hypothetical protein
MPPPTLGGHAVASDTPGVAIAATDTEGLPRCRSAVAPPEWHHASVSPTAHTPSAASPRAHHGPSVSSRPPARIRVPWRSALRPLSAVIVAPIEAGSAGVGTPRIAVPTATRWIVMGAMEEAFRPLRRLADRPAGIRRVERPRWASRGGAAPANRRHAHARPGIPLRPATLPRPKKLGPQPRAAALGSRANGPVARSPWTMVPRRWNQDGGTEIWDRRLGAVGPGPWDGVL